MPCVLQAHRRGRVIGCGVLAFLSFGQRKWVKRAQGRGTILKTDTNVAITPPPRHSNVRFTNGTISPVPR